MEWLVIITRAVIALMLFSLTSNANAAGILLKDYKSPKNEDEKALLEMYLDSVKDGAQFLNAIARRQGQRPEFCLPENLALTVDQAEDIMMREAKKMTDPDDLPVALVLIHGLKDTFPCDEKH
jgi:hypothetical protein